MIDCVSAAICIHVRPDTVEGGKKDTHSGGVCLLKGETNQETRCPGHQELICINNL